MSSMPWTVRLAWAWHLIGGATTLAAFVLWLIGGSILWAWPVAVAGGVAVGWLWARQPIDAPETTPNPIARAVLAIAAIAMVVTAWTTLIPEWDGMAIWGVKAKLLARGELDGEWLRAPLNLPAHPEYPLHVPLRGALLASVVGWHGKLLPLLLAIDVLAIGLLLLGSLEVGRRRWASTWVAVGVLAVPALWDEVPRGYADPTIALALTATLVALGHWLRHGERSALVLATLSAAVGAWTKQEGLVLLWIAFAAAWLLAPAAGRRRAPVAVAGAVGSVSVLPWQLTRRGLGLATEPFGWRGAEQLERIPTILERMGAEMANIGRWSLLWPAAALVVLLLAGRAAGRRRLDPERALPALVLVTGLGAWAAIYVATPHDLVWHLETSLHRLLLQLSPAAMLTLVAAVTDRVESSPGDPPIEG